MSLLPLKPTDVDVVSHLNDIDTISGYSAAIASTITEFVNTHKRPPVVLCIGAVGGVHARRSLECGAHHVVVVDPIRDNIEAARGNLKHAYDTTRYTCLCKSTLQLPGDEQYDMVVMDMFGSSLNSGGAATYIWDLLQRRIVREFVDAEDRVIHYVLPSEGAMTMRLYHVPALTVDRWVDQPYSKLTKYADVPNETKPKIRWIRDVELGNVLLSEGGGCEPLSDRVDVLSEIYDAIDEPNIVWPEHVSILPHRTDVPLDQCLLVLEWSIYFLATEQSVGTVLGFERRLPAATRRARLLSWGRDVTHLNTISDVLAPIHFKVDYRLAGGMSMTVVPSCPEEPIPKSIPDKKRKAVVDNTYAKIGLAVHAPKSNVTLRNQKQDQ